VACCCMWGPASLLLVAATSQPLPALRSKQITNWMAHPGNGGAEGGGRAEGSSEAVGEAPAENVAQHPLESPHRRRGATRNQRDLRRVSRNIAKMEAAAVTSALGNSSETEEEDDLVIILEDHTDLMPPRLLAFESRPAPDDLQEKALVEPELTTGDGLDSSEVTDLEVQALQRRKAILNLCNNCIHIHRLHSSNKALTFRAVRTAQKVIHRSLGRCRRSRVVRAPLVRIIAHWRELLTTSQTVLQEELSLEASIALPDACNAMFTKNMLAGSLQTLIERYDTIIVILTENDD